MKKLISLLLAVLMVAAFAASLVASGQEEAENSDNSDWRDEEINLVMWDYPIEGPLKEKTLADFKVFEEMYPNITIEHKLFQPEPGTDRIEFTTAMAGGNGPSAYAGAPSVVMKLWANQGFFYPLNEYLDEWEETPFLQPAGVKIATVDENVYGIPTMLTPFVLAYNINRFEEEGLDPANPPKTWDEYVEAAIALTDRANGEYGISLMGSGIADWWFQFYVWQAGGEITTVEKDGTIELHLTEQPAIDALQFYKDLRWKHDVVQEDILMGFGDQATDFSLGKAGMIIFTPEWIPWWTSMGLKQEDIGITPMPTGPAGVNTVSTSGVFLTMNPFISKNERDATWEYMKFVARRELVIERYETLAAANVKYPSIPMYTDINIQDILEGLSEVWVDAMNDAADSSREEYILVEDIRPYLVQAIQAVLVDEKADPKTELEKVAASIQREVIDPFNAEVKN
jgi:multiple sugar transport system substrate-binding protein